MGLAGTRGVVAVHGGSALCSGIECSDPNSKRSLLIKGMSLEGAFQLGDTQGWHFIKMSSAFNCLAGDFTGESVARHCFLF